MLCGLIAAKRGFDSGVGYRHAGTACESRNYLVSNKIVDLNA
jgi:hypothetical protein